MCLPIVHTLTVRWWQRFNVNVTIAYGILGISMRGQFKEIVIEMVKRRVLRVYGESDAFFNHLLIYLQMQRSILSELYTVAMPVHTLIEQYNALIF